MPEHLDPEGFLEPLAGIEDMDQSTRDALAAGRKNSLDRAEAAERVFNDPRFPVLVDRDPRRFPDEWRFPRW